MIRCMLPDHYTIFHWPSAGCIHTPSIYCMCVRLIRPRHHPIFNSLLGRLNLTLIEYFIMVRRMRPDYHTIFHWPSTWCIHTLSIYSVSIRLIRPRHHPIFNSLLGRLNFTHWIFDNGSVYAARLSHNIPLTVRLMHPYTEYIFCVYPANPI